MKLAPEELAKLHFVSSLFAELLGQDLYLAQQVKEAIELALEETDEAREPGQNFHRAAVLLLQSHFRRHPRHGFAHWDATGQRWDPLWARQEIVAVIKRLAVYPSATVIITGLRPSICPPGKRWNRAMQHEYAEAVRLIQQLACGWSTPSGNLTLLFF